MLYESRLVGLSVRGKNISGLHEHVNITMNLTMGVNVTKTPLHASFAMTLPSVTLSYH